MDPEQMIIELTEALALDDAQVEKIRSIIDDEAAKRDTIFEKYAGQGRSARKEMRSEMMALHEDTIVQIKSLLSEEQFIEYEVYLEKKRQEKQAAFEKWGSLKHTGRV